MSEPYLKFAGGKSRLVAKIRPLFLGPCRGWYVEPFVGSAAVYLKRRAAGDLAGDLFRGALLCDRNAALIATHEVVRDDLDLLLEAFLKFPVGEDYAQHYEEIRERFNGLLLEHGSWPNPGLEGPLKVQLAAHYIYLNRAGFNGLYRVNKKGRFNIPVGDYKRIVLPSEARLRECARLFSGALFLALPFEECFAMLVKLGAEGAQIYADPPYVPRSVTSSFVAYTKGGFSDADQVRLAQDLASLAASGAEVVASNHDVPAVRELYEPLGFRAEALQVQRSVSARAKGRSSVGEVLLVHEGVAALRARVAAVPREVPPGEGSALVASVRKLLAERLPAEPLPDAPTVLEVFAGAGGSALGLREAGFRTIGLLEKDADACATLRAAGFGPVLEGDVREALVPVCVRASLAWFSPPCPGWSTAGNKLGARDPRNGFPWSFDLLSRLGKEGLLPSYAIFENVPGLVAHLAKVGCRGGMDPQPMDCPRCYFDQVILPTLRAFYPWVDARLLESADFGVPQNRTRVIVLAGPRPVPWPEPTHSLEALVHAKWVTGTYFSDLGLLPVGRPTAVEEAALARLSSAPPLQLPWRTVRQALGLLAWGTETNTSSGKVRVPRGPDVPSCQPVAGGNAHGGLLGWDDPERPSWWHRSSTVDLPERSIGTMRNASIEGLDPKTRRRLEVEECATLQDFPDGYPFVGTKTSRYRQVGNAVPRRLAAAVGRRVMEALHAP